MSTDLLYPSIMFGLDRSVARERQSESVIETSTRRLRTAILIGALRPGQKLVEAELSADLGISRTSVREALRALEAERLIELRPNRGPSVARLGVREVDEIHQVWSMLTGEAVFSFAERATRSDISHLKRALAKLLTVLPGGTGAESLDATNAFFWLIMRSCGNGVLLEVVIALVSRVNFLRAQALLDAGWRRTCGKEIESILSAISQREPAAARSAVHRHIASACEAARKAAAVTSIPDIDSPLPPRSTAAVPLGEYLDRSFAGPPNGAELRPTSKSGRGAGTTRLPGKRRASKR